jgi:predicted RNase H-like HicB family nuclease
MHYQALIEEWPNECMAYFRELPGCFSSAPTYEEALAAAPSAIASHLRWLKSSGLVDEIDTQIEVIVSERLAAQDGRIGPSFEADLAPPNDEEIDLALNIAAAARTDLIELYDGIPADARERVRDAGGWSANEHMRHIIEEHYPWIKKFGSESL